MIWMASAWAADPGLDRLQASPLALSPEGLATLERSGLVIDRRVRQRSMGALYEEIYRQDLPVFVSGDSVLHAVHRTFDETLVRVESEVLMPDLRAGLDAMARVELEGFPESTRADAHAFVSTARDLLAQDPRTLLGQRLQVAEPEPLMAPWFGGVPIDPSQFEPRGHYEAEPGYFQAMMLLGRTQLPTVVYDAAGAPKVRRDALLGALALARMRTAEGAAAPLDELERVVGEFVGPTDSLGAGELLARLRPLGAHTPAGLARASDDALIRALTAGTSSKIRNQLSTGKEPVGFAVLGQRYTDDAHVLSAVVGEFPEGLRLMPDPLDVAYAALGADAAWGLLDPTGGYGAALRSQRARVDHHPEGYWTGTSYTRWVAAIRALSRPPPPNAPTGDAWDRRRMGAQLASWAELRHDTLLYAEQSYTAQVSCEFPAAWVEPEPAFWDALRDYGLGTDALLAGLPLTPESAERLRAPQRTLAATAAVLGEMARAQVAGVPFTPAQLAFVNEAVVSRRGGGGCGGPQVVDVEGWYPRLFVSPLHALESDPIVADVHTQPTDAGGVMVGRVLHAATGPAELIVVRAHTCDGDRVFVGPSSMFHSVITDGFERLTDSAWIGQADRAEVVPWLDDLVVP